ncbi:hypothetical protein GCM10009647_067800 [Streptomyces sanglieri]
MRLAGVTRSKSVAPAKNPLSWRCLAQDVHGKVLVLVPGDGAAGEVDHTVGVLDDALQAVFGEEDGDAEVVDEPGDGGQDLFCCGRCGVRCSWAKSRVPSARAS